MTKLHQIIAIEKGEKSRGESALTQAYHRMQKAPLFSGITRTYQPKDDDGDRLPPESTRVQVRVEELVEYVVNRLTRMYDVVATHENANTFAKADVAVDDEVLLADVPVTVLLFLEKQLVDLRTFISKMPLLDPAETWEPNTTDNVWVTAPTETTRTKKTPRNHVKAEATDKHPAQVEMWYEDVVVGYWKTIKASGAMAPKRQAELLDRVDRLQTAVKLAREEANSVEVVDKKIGEKFLGYLFGA